MNTLPTPATPARPKIETMTDDEIMAELAELQRTFTGPDFDDLENELRLRAAVLGWTGNPLLQPPTSVLACARQVKAGAV